MYKKLDWLRVIDTALANQVEISYTTKNGKTRQIKMSPTVAFIAYHIADKFADWNTGEEVRCSHSKLATTFHMSTKTVSEAFILLSELGFLIRDVTKETIGGTNFYDLAMPNPSSLETRVCSSETGGVFEGNKGVVSQGQQTTKRTTKETNKLKTNASVREANAPASPVVFSLSSIKKASNLFFKLREPKKGNEVTDPCSLETGVLFWERGNVEQESEDLLNWDEPMPEREEKIVNVGEDW
ncbi:hypothetical protein [Amycolatopsis sp. lyj-112]|uniref:hypothetical protein n=1 Tax=Amycolatopsis sp. lyj-112 TaxID=2789288 RepID=UPI00397CDA51